MLPYLFFFLKNSTCTDRGSTCFIGFQALIAVACGTVTRTGFVTLVLVFGFWSAALYLTINHVTSIYGNDDRDTFHGIDLYLYQVSLWPLQMIAHPPTVAGISPAARTLGSMHSTSACHTRPDLSLGGVWNAQHMFRCPVHRVVFHCTRRWIQQQCTTCSSRV